MSNAREVIDLTHPLREELERRREAVFLALAGIFLGTMAMLNIIGITRFVQLGPLSVAVGVLPYPLTFLCTDLISEFFGRRRANLVVWIGLLLNGLVIGVIMLGEYLPPVSPAMQPPWQTLPLSKPIATPSGRLLEGEVELFSLLYQCTAGAVLASMVAYLSAQFCDVWLFHYWKKLTNGRHLWLRNNGSTLISQLVDSVMVVSITFGSAFFRGEMALEALFMLLISNYAFKAAAALLDTLPFYVITGWLKGYLQLDPLEVR